MPIAPSLPVAPGHDRFGPADAVSRRERVYEQIDAGLQVIGSVVYAATFAVGCGTVFYLLFLT